MNRQSSNESGWIERIFGLRAAGSTIGREALGGFATFLTMAYILVVNPAILSTTGMPLAGAVAATALSAAFATLAMGLFANYPVALAPGMGLNAFFAFGVCAAAGVPWPTALGIVFWTGIAFLALTLTGARAVLVRAMPRTLTHAGAAGIGLFIALLGFKQGGLVIADPNTLLTLGSLGSRPARLALFGLAITLILFARKRATAVFWGLAATALLAFSIGAVEAPAQLFVWPSAALSALPGLDIDLWGALELRYLPLALTMLFFALFDTLGTLLAVGHQAGLTRANGELPRLERALAADAAGMVGGALLGTSAVTSYIESGSGVASGARTGLASVFTSLFLFASLFFAPLVEVVGRGIDGASPITAPALILVGVLMVGAVREIDWRDPTEAAPAFVTMVLMPFTFHIAHGLAAGIVVFALVKLAAGRGREVHPLLYGLALLVVLRYALLPA